MMSVPRHVFGFRPGAADGDPARADLLGGKGASLAALSRAGFPVPPGFTISTACSQEVQQLGRWPEWLDGQLRQALTQLETSTERTYGSGPQPLLLAVRSGAATSMPGMMDTILNCGLHPGLIDTWESPERFWHDYAEYVRMFGASVAGIRWSGQTAPSAETLARQRLAIWQATTNRPFPDDPWQALVMAIDAVFASYHSPRARAYRRKHDVRATAGTAVNVQVMFPSQRSGVLFTANPHDPAAGEMVLEASWGLGEAVVSGSVTPDVYVLDASSGRVKHTTPGTRPGADAALRDEQIAELARLGRAVEQLYEVPVDLEWGLADGHCAVLQARPIRGLDVLADVAVGRQAEIERLRDSAGTQHVVWVEHNLAETLPSPLPLTWDVVRWFMSGRGGFGQLYRLLGFQPTPVVDEQGFLELICGKIYVDPRRAAQLFFGTLPLEYEVDAILRDPRTLEVPPRHLNLDAADSFLFLRLPSLVWRLWSASRQARQLRAEQPQRFNAFVHVNLDNYLDEVAQVEFAHLNESALVAEFFRRRDWVLGPLAVESLLPGYFGGLALSRLTLRLQQILGPEDGERWAGDLTSGLEGDVTVAQNLELHAVAHNEQRFSQFLERFGHRAVLEMELAEPRWSEDPAPLEQMLERLKAAQGPRPAERYAAQVELREQADRLLPNVLASAGGASLYEQLSVDLAEARRLLPYRETGKFHLMRGYASLRAPLVELARRWDLGRDLFFLYSDELREFPTRREQLREEIARRKLRWQSARQLKLEPLIDSRRLDQLGEPTRPRDPAIDDGHGRWRCRVLASGFGTGSAVVIRDPQEAGELPIDYVLVCPSTDPGWTPLLVGARGLIVERGGVLSHGAIVAREFGIPSVALEGATELIRSGARLEVDAQHGYVRLLEGAPARAQAH